jgi:hypothetical protein
MAPGGLGADRLPFNRSDPESDIAEPLSPIHTFAVRSGAGDAAINGRTPPERRRPAFEPSPGGMLKWKSAAFAAK